MITARSEIEIAAPVDVVWQALTDLRAYGAWNPFIYRVTGEVERLRLGGRIRLHVRWAQGGETSSAEEITALEPPAGTPRRAALAYRFCGPLARLGLVRAVRWQWLDELPGGGTFYRTEERFSGLLARFVPLGRVQAGFEMQARALAGRCGDGEERSKGG